jgi:hypothetical protein
MDPEAVYGVPYMTASAPQLFEITLRGFSPRELAARAERECREHFGECAWRIDEATCRACMGTIGGRVRLYETRVIASGAPPRPAGVDAVAGSSPVDAL